MYGAGIDQMSECHLMNVPEPLVNRMGDDIKDQRMVYGNKPIYRVVDDFANIGHCWGFVKGPARAGGKCTKGEIKKLFLPHPGMIVGPSIFNKLAEWQ
jgi:hypothetical protein